MSKNTGDHFSALDESGISRFQPFLGAVLGAVSLRCATAATCPVTLVKLPGEEPEV